MREIKVLFQAEDNDYGKCITEIINMMNNELVISFNIIEKRIKKNIKFTKMKKKEKVEKTMTKEPNMKIIKTNLERK